jgi:3-deoxy-7-phosphoheptulonate synthase
MACIKSLLKDDKRVGPLERPFVIAGPCSAETEEQVMSTARELATNPSVSIFRAGIWKPRTRPNSFEGVGAEGLRWMENAKRETGLPIATEVANEKHVEIAMKHDIDMLWIGARTTVNPFTVQEIADALKGSDVAVLIKNPVSPDIDLWTGAIERLLNAGITRIGAIHRGFTSFEKTKYRNQPKWQIPIELRRRLPEVPLICDPSHIAGNREYLAELSQRSMDLNFEGLMVEVHPDPDNAWSDAKQQITSAELKQLLESLIIRESVPTDPKLVDILKELRKQIDVFDDLIIDLLEQRMEVVEKIGLYKKENNITILQRPRWEEIITSSIERGGQKGLSPELIDTIFKAIHQESINRQAEIMKK